MDHTQSCYINPEGTPSSPTYLPLPAVEHLLSNSSATVVRCWFTGEAKTSNKTPDRAFAVAAATAWNRLPPKVRTATSTEQFSRALKTHLFTLD